MLVMIGHDNFVDRTKVETVLQPGSSPVAKIKKAAADSGLLIDATAGHKTRSVIVLTSGRVVLSSLSTAIIQKRVNGKFDE